MDEHSEELAQSKKNRMTQQQWDLKEAQKAIQGIFFFCFFFFGFEVNSSENNVGQKKLDEVQSKCWFCLNSPSFAKVCLCSFLFSFFFPFFSFSFLFFPLSLSSILYNNKKIIKHLTVSLGMKTLLCLPDRGSLSQGHCLIVPTEHSSSLLTLDEDVHIEIRVFIYFFTLQRLSFFFSYYSQKIK